jgi:hypothetical protein
MYSKNKCNLLHSVCTHTAQTLDVSTGVKVEKGESVSAG